MGLLSLFLIVATFESCSCSKSASAIALMTDLLANSSTDVRPGLDYNDSVIVNITFNLAALVELNEVKGYMLTIGFFEVVWLDERMTWDPDDYDGISYIAINSEKVWIPKLIVSNPADRIYIFHEIASEVVFSSNGEAFWEPGSVMKTMCYIQIPAYPFDVHYCYIRINSWGGEFSDLILNSAFDFVNTQIYTDNVEWALTDTYAVSERTDYKYQKYSPSILFGIQYKRRPLFLLINILMPLVFLSILNSAVFLLPQESGERVSFSVTVLLSFAVFLNVIGDHIPNTSSPMPYVCYYVLIELINSCIITVATILCQRLYQYHGQRPVPRWILKCLCMLPIFHRNTISAEVKEVKMNNEVKTNIVESEIQSWKQVISKLDQTLFVIFFLAAISVALGFILSMASMN